MGRGSGGGGRSRGGGGISSLQGVPASASSFAVGDVVRFPATNRSSGFEGTVSRIGRSNVTVSVETFGNRSVSITRPAADFRGGLRARGNNVVRFD